MKIHETSMFGNPYPELPPSELALESNTHLLKMGSRCLWQQSCSSNIPSIPNTSDCEKPLKNKAVLLKTPTASSL